MLMPVVRIGVMGMTVAQWLVAMPVRVRTSGCRMVLMVVVSIVVVPTVRVPVLVR